MGTSPGPAGVIDRLWPRCRGRWCVPATTGLTTGLPLVLWVTVDEGPRFETPIVRADRHDAGWARRPATHLARHQTISDEGGNHERDR